MANNVYWKHPKGHRIGLLSHFDLDGAGCRILLDKLFNFDVVYNAGYNKIETWIRDGKYYDVDKLIVADVALTKECYDVLSGHFGRKLVVLDHHPETGELEQKNGSTIVYDQEKSGTMLCFERFYTKYAPVGIKNMATICDSYDLWKTDVPYWYTCDSMNTLFWHYGLFDFVKMFKDGFYGTFSPDQAKILKTKNEEIRRKLAEADANKIEEGNVLIFFPIDQDMVNRVTLAYPDYDVFLCVTVWEQNYGISARTTADHDLGKFFGEIVESGRFSFVANGGGHPKAAGIGFESGTTNENIINLLSFITKKYKKD